MVEEDLKKKIKDTIINVSVLRGLVTTKAIDIEGMIDAIIEAYFIKSEKQSDFLVIVLSNPYFSFGLKIDILYKVLNKISFDTYEGFKSDLYKIRDLRNNFAHAFMFGFDGDLTYSKGEKTGEIRKAKEMYDEFMSLYLKVYEQLNKIWEFLIEELKKGKKSV